MKGEESMIYTCEDCSFLFYRIAEVKKCPSCENENFRIATKEEIQRKQDILKRGRENSSYEKTR